MSGYKGEVEEFTRIHKDVETANTTISSDLKQLRGNMEATAGAWEGNAAVAFRRLMERFDENSAKLNQALQGIGELLSTAGSQYEAQEEEQASSMSNIMSGLDG